MRGERWVIGIAEADDLPALAHLMANAPLGQRYGVTRDAATVALREALAEGDLVLVARSPDRGGLMGLAWVIGTRAFAGSAYLRLLLVAESHQRRGLGAELLAHVEVVARGWTWAQNLFLFATSDNAPARRFYERHGYRHVGDIPDLVRPGLDESLYLKPLRVFGG